MVGLLNVCCLFSPTVYLTDVHLGDNPIFLSSYTSGSQDGLYARVRDLAKLGCIRLLLRDESVRERGNEPVIACESFSDVFRSWLVHDNDRAGVSRGIRGERARYFSDLDRWSIEAGVDRYSYRSVKQLFMSGVRTTHHASGIQAVVPGFQRLSTNDRRAFDELLDEDWFTLADVYRFLDRADVPMTSGLWRLHGLLNEIAYTRSVSTIMAGLEGGSQQIEELLSAQQIGTEPDDEGEVAEEGSEPMAWLLERADAVLEGPDLSLIGILSPTEIAALRDAGRSAFAMLRLASDPDYVAATPDIEASLLRAFADYWQTICDYLVREYRSAATSPTKLGIFLGSLPRGVRRLGVPFARIAVNVGTPAVAGGGLSSSVVKAVEKEAGRRDLSLRFLIAGETDSMRRARAVVPDRCWMTSKRPALYIPDSRRD